MRSTKLVLILIVLAMAAASCGIIAPTNAPPTVYAVGQPATEAGIEIILNSYEQVDNQVHLSFTVTNKSQQEFNVSTRYTMEGQNEEGNKMVFVMCPENELGGRIAIGESLTGNVCLTGFKDLSNSRVLYDPTAQIAYKIAWELD